MNWWGLVIDGVSKIPWERIVVRPKVRPMPQFSIPDGLKVAETAPPKENMGNVSQGPARPSKIEDVSVACVACGVGHFAGAAKLLNEAVRFRDDGITSNQVLDDIAGAIGELNALERVDLTPEKLQNTSNWERPIADEALRESRKLRHRLESLGSMEEVEQTAADSEVFYKKLFRQWFKLRFSHLSPEKVESITERVGKLGSEDKERVLKRAEELIQEV